MQYYIIYNIIIQNYHFITLQVTEARDLFEERIVELEEELKEAQTHTEEVQKTK